jgi:hypothetical protein
MTAELIQTIVELALTLAKEHESSDGQRNRMIEDTLLELAQTTVQAYREHTGEPLNPG